MEQLYYTKGEQIKSGWRLNVTSGEGQSFLEIMNLIKEFGAGGLEWEKGIGFTQKKTNTTSS